METLRKPFQGVLNIIRFNWHFYAVSIGLVFLLWIFPLLKMPIHPNYTLIPAAILLFVTLNSLLVSAYVYDLSNLYSLQWLDKLVVDQPNSMVNVNAGFDETSELLAHKYEDAQLLVLDFYDPKKHTEISIRRARKAHPPYPNTLSITTDKVPLKDNSVDIVFAILSAHEIRNDNERVVFFEELRRILTVNGKIIVAEHLRNVPNFFGYTIGFLHFHSKYTWRQTFRNANLKVSKKTKITPFLNSFLLENA